MKKFTKTLTTAFIAFLLLSFGTAKAQTVHFDDIDEPNKATSITGVMVDGTSYDVTFVVGQEAFHYYGTYPGTFTLTTSEDAEAAAIIMDDALNAENALKIGTLGELGVETFHVPFGSFIDDLDLQNIEFWWGSILFNDSWEAEYGIAYYNVDARNWALFELSTAINEELSGVSISVFPNPATDVLNIEASNEMQNVMLVNQTGQVVRSIELEAGKTSIDLNGLGTGVYFVKIETAKGTTTKKVVIK